MPIPPPLAGAESTSALRSAILSGELPPGVRLPPERELAERFGVNRVTIRAALARLAGEHLLSVRQGSGYTVRDFRRDGGPDLIGALLGLTRSRAERRRLVSDLLLVRRQLARALFERLLEEADKEALARAGRALDRLADAAARKASPAELAELDLEIATELALASRSAVLSLCLNPIAAVLCSLPGLAEAMYRTPLENVAAWRGVLAWIGGTRRTRAEVDTLVEQLAARDDATLAAMFGASRR